MSGDDARGNYFYARLRVIHARRYLVDARETMVHARGNYFYARLRVVHARGYLVDARETMVHARGRARSTKVRASKLVGRASIGIDRA